MAHKDRTISLSIIIIAFCELLEANLNSGIKTLIVGTKIFLLIFLFIAICVVKKARNRNSSHARVPRTAGQQAAATFGRKQRPSVSFFILLFCFVFV